MKVYNRVITLEEGYAVVKNGILIKGPKIYMGENSKTKDYTEVRLFTIDDVEYYIEVVDGYDANVTALIRCKYSLDAELALINNYIDDPDKYREEMIEFQAWRKKCKAAVN